MTNIQNKKKMPPVMAAFIMATSAIGPGFLTQTALFTAQYLYSLFFVIICVIIIDALIQSSIWSVIGASGMRGQEVANGVIPGMGIFFTIIIAFGGLAFNVGNISGTALGLESLFGIDERMGAVIGGIVAIFLLLTKNGKTLIGKIALVVSMIIIMVIITICFTSNPPIETVLKDTFKLNFSSNVFLPMLTLLGGSCGGYIAFSGAHRLIDEGYGGTPEQAHTFRKTALKGVAISGITRLLLFFAVLGVCTVGSHVITKNIESITVASNPAAQAFFLAAGNFGKKLFGLSMFCAGITSALGASYTSISFLKTLSPFIEKYEKWFICGFIAISTTILAIFGGAKNLILMAGAVNGCILPLALVCVLIACHKKSIVGENYHHPMILNITGWVLVLLTGYMAFISLKNLTQLFT